MVQTRKEAATFHPKNYKRCFQQGCRFRHVKGTNFDRNPTRNEKTPDRNKLIASIDKHGKSEKDNKAKPDHFLEAVRLMKGINGSHGLKACCHSISTSPTATSTNSKFTYDNAVPTTTSNCTESSTPVPIQPIPTNKIPTNANQTLPIKRNSLSRFSFVNIQLHRKFRL